MSEVSSEQRPGAAVEAPETAQAWQEFTASLESVEEAARDFGIRRDLPEGRFVSALLAAIRLTGELGQSAHSRLMKTLSDAHAAAELEVERARQVTKAANLAVTQARNAQIALTVQQEIATARLSEQVLPMLLDKLREAVVIRAKQWNTTAEWKRYGIVALVTVVLFSGGYVVRLFQDDPLTMFANRCLVQPQFANGAYWCDVTNLISQGTRPAK